MELGITQKDCLWERLATTDSPLVLYGTGNGADKLIDALARIGKTPAGVFASDGFVRRRTFHDMPVLSYAEARTQFGDGMTVLAAFGSPLPDVMDKMRTLDAHHTFYIPDLPLFGGDLFTWEYFLAHRAEIDAAYALLSDAESRALYREMFLYRLQGELRHLSRTQSDFASYRELLDTETIRTALDGGAFNGDSARVMMQAFPALSKILACEPDARTFRKLSAFAEESGGVLQPLHCALSDTAETLTFHSSGSRGSGAAGANRRGADVSVSTQTIDTLCADLSPDLIKLDVEGWESAALRGAAQTILRTRPALAVSLYHRAEDIFALPLWIAAHTIGNYRFHMRRVPCYPAWDLMLYAVPSAV